MADEQMFSRARYNGDTLDIKCVHCGQEETEYETDHIRGIEGIEVRDALEAGRYTFYCWHCCRTSYAKLTK